MSLSLSSLISHDHIDPQQSVLFQQDLLKKNRLLKQFIGHAGPALTTAVTQSSITHQACRASESLMTGQAPMTGLTGDGLLDGAIIRSPWTGMTAHCRESVSQHCLY